VHQPDVIRALADGIGHARVVMPESMVTHSGKP
jgi:hypothetical protein